MLNKPESKHWRTMRCRARKIWAAINGPIPKGYVIHHRDGDFTNNDISNLSCMTTKEHGIIHHAGPEYHIPRHNRPNRKKYMQEYYNTARKQPAICVICKQTFLADKYNEQLTCSHSCGTKLFWVKRKNVSSETRFL